MVTPGFVDARFSLDKFLKELSAVWQRSCVRVAAADGKGVMADLYLMWGGTDSSDPNGYGTRTSMVPANMVFDQPQQVFKGCPTTSKPALLAMSDRILFAAASDLTEWGQHTDYLGFTSCQSWPNMPAWNFVPGTASSWGPALANWGPGALMVWNGTGSDTRIWSAQYNQAQNSWGNQYLTLLPGTGAAIQSGSTPALVNYNGRLLMVWRGEGSNDNLYYATLTDGVHWAGNKPIPGAASTIQPAITLFHGVPVLCFKGGTGDTGIYTTTYYEATDSWARVVPTGRFGTSHGPSLAVYQNVLFMCWKGIAGDTNLFWATTINNLLPAAWSLQHQIPYVGSSVGPAAVVY